MTYISPWKNDSHRNWIWTRQMGKATNFVMKYLMGWLLNRKNYWSDVVNSTEEEWHILRAEARGTRSISPLHIKRAIILNLGDSILNIELNVNIKLKNVILNLGEQHFNCSPFFSPGFLFFLLFSCLMFKRNV